MTARFWSALCLIALAAAGRLLPHPANVTPVIAMALFAGASFNRKPWSVLLPLVAMFVSDLVIGQGSPWHEQMFSVYGSIVLISLLGLTLSRRQTALRVGAASIASSLLFFVVTNLTVWISSGMYARTLSGLVECYVMGLPFLRNGLLGDLGFSVLLFGAWALISKLITSRENLGTV